jgi:hypothetical protein
MQTVSTNRINSLRSGRHSAVIPKQPGSYQCRACGLEFRSVGAFDNHRYGKYTDRHCRTVDELLAKEWNQDKNGVWRGPSGFEFADLREGVE